MKAVSLALVVGFAALGLVGCGEDKPKATPEKTETKAPEAASAKAPAAAPPAASANQGGW